jgi:hypothetical protein
VYEREKLELELEQEQEQSRERTLICNACAIRSRALISGPSSQEAASTDMVLRQLIYALRYVSTAQ